MLAPATNSGQTKLQGFRFMDKIKCHGGEKTSESLSKKRIGLFLELPVCNQTLLIYKTWLDGTLIFL